MKTPSRIACRLLCTSLIAGLVATHAAAHAAPQAAPQAAPEMPGDAVLQLLQDRGLLPATGDAGQMLRQARDAASELVIVAMNFLGVPYRRGGGNADEGFDCSGFTRHIFGSSLGLVLPRRAEQQAQDHALYSVMRDELRPGDLVFFNTMKRAFSHVGIYLGDGKFIHAPRSGTQVRIEDMRQAYWNQRFDGARRAELESAAPEATPTAYRP